MVVVKEDILSVASAVGDHYIAVKVVEDDDDFVVLFVGDADVELSDIVGQVGVENGRDDDVAAVDDSLGFSGHSLMM